MHRTPTSLKAASTVAVALFLAHCSSSSSSSTNETNDAGHGTPDSSQQKKDGGSTGHDATSPDAKGHDARVADAVTSADVAAEAAQVVDAHSSDAAHDAAHDAGVDAVAICNTALGNEDAGPSGSLDPNFENGDKGGLGAATPSAVLVDGTGRIYIVGSRVNCVSASSKADFAISRFLPTGAVDESFGPGPDDAGTGAPGKGTVCLDFMGGNDAAQGAAFDAAGNIVLTGYASESGDASNLTTTLALVRLTPAGVLDTSFNNTGKLKANPAAPFGTCGATASGCSPPEAQDGFAVAIAPSGTIYVVGTTVAYPAVGDSYNGAFIGSFNDDGSINGNFNSSGSHANATYGVPGFVTDDKIQDLSDVIVEGSNIVVTGTTLGTPIDAGGFKNRRFLTRRYTSTGALDASFNPSGTTPGEIEMSVGLNDYALSVRSEPATGAILVAGIASVGGAASPNAGIYASGYMAAVRYTSSGALDPTFGTSDAGGVFVSKALQAFPAYEHFLLGLECNGQPVLGGFVLSSGDQAPALLRLTPSGQVDTTFGPSADAGGIVSEPVSGKNVIGSAVMVDPSRKILLVAGDNADNPILDHLLH